MSAISFKVPIHCIGTLNSIAPTQLDVIYLIVLNGVSLTKCYNRSGECRTRSDCTYVQADLVLHSPQKTVHDREVRLRVKNYLQKKKLSLINESW